MALTVSHYRFGVDELAESTHGWYAAEDTDPSPGTIPLNTVFLLRFCVQADGTAHSNIINTFQYRLNGGTWTNITSASNVARASVTVALVDSANCTKRLSGTGTFEASAAGQTHDGQSGGNANDIVSNGNSETECGLTLRSADLVGGDQVEFRIISNATPFDAYSFTPKITIPSAAGQPTVRRAGMVAFAASAQPIGLEGVRIH